MMGWRDISAHIKIKADRKQAKNIVKLIFRYIALLIPVLWGFYIVYYYGVNLCFWDEWTYMDNYDNFLTWKYLWEPHNEHRMFFPKVLTYIVGEIFSWNSRAFMFTSQLYLFLLYFIAGRILVEKQKLRNVSWTCILEIFVLGCCIYNTCQWENLLWGFQIAWFMIVSLTAAVFHFFHIYLQTNKKQFLGIAAVLSIVVSYSSFHGLAIWGAWAFVFFCLYISKEKIPRASVMGISITGVCSIAVYFVNYPIASTHKQFLTENTDQLLSYFIANIGASVLPHDTTLSYLVGFIALMILLLMIIYFIRRKAIKRNIQILAPMIMACGAMLAVSMGRSGGGTETFVSSRYTTNSMLFVTFFLIMGFKMLKEHLGGGSLGDDEYKAESNILEHLDYTLAVSMVILCLALPLLIVSRNFGEMSNVETVYKSRLHSKIVLCNYEDADLEEVRTFCAVDQNGLEQQKEIFSFVRENSFNTFYDDISAFVFSETGIMGDTAAWDLNYYAFNHKNIIVNNETLSIFVNNIDGIETEDFKNYNYRIVINGIAYQMVLDGECIRFFCTLDKLSEGVNELQFILSNQNMTAWSKKICIFKNGAEVLAADAYQQDLSILSEYSRIEENRNLCVDSYNGESPVDGMVLYNNKVSSMNGWVQVENCQDKKCYLRVGQALFELNWERRDDVVAVFEDAGYSGFTGDFIPLYMEPGEYDTGFVIVDGMDMTYTEQTLSKIIVP